MNTKLINIQVLALLGDAIYSLYIREKLIEVGYNDIEKIQKKQVEYVSAKGEVKALNYLIDNNLLTNDELDIVKRGRNQPFNKNHLRPCPMLENPEILQRMVKETGAKSTDLESPESAEHLCSKCVPYANNWKPYADKIWSETPKIKRSYENYEKH